jgi:hypothetical protein
MCTLYKSNYYLCDFLEIIDNEKIEENNGPDDDVYILHIKILLYIQFIKT